MSVPEREEERVAKEKTVNLYKNFVIGSLDTGAFFGDSCRVLPTEGISRTGHPKKK